jgi:hypothetical protein
MTKEEKVSAGGRRFSVQMYLRSSYARKLYQLICAAIPPRFLTVVVAGTAKRFEGKTMEIKRSGTQPCARGSGDYFSGTVRIDLLFQAPEPARVSGASVTFEPGARTAWHTHPLGQTLIVTSGFGRVQRRAGPN